MSDKAVKLEVRGQEPLDGTAPLFSNFVAISRVGGEVQFEFIFVDINQLALLAQKFKEGGTHEPPKLMGKTVAKIVVPTLSFVQLRDHIMGLMKGIEEELQKGEVQHGLSGTGG